jgi:glycosyltransferase involved in cell wall biosynthesis
MPKFSIITPVWLDRNAKENERQPRYEMFLRCINSVFSQTCKDFEWILVDDMSVPSVESIMAELPQAQEINYRVIKPKEKSGRIIARNLGMAEATGDYICWLDSDDEYSSIYLQAIDEATRVYPDYPIFNFNHLVFHFDYNTTVRKFMDMDIQKDNPFGSGNIGAGSFVFKRTIYDEIGPIPELGLWQFAAKFFEEFPETKPFFEAEGRPGQYNSLGNPWGEDYYYWYKMTRKHKAKYLDTAIYFVHSRFNHKWKDDPEREEQSTAPSYNKNNI